MDGAAIGTLIAADAEAFRARAAVEVTEHALCRGVLAATGERQRLTFTPSTTGVAFDDPVAPSA